MAKNFIQQYVHQGIEKYQGEYDYNSVVAYLTASLLKANIFTSNQLSLVLNCNKRTAQRYLSGEVIPDLNTIVLMLNSVDYSIENLIANASEFISNRYYAVDFTYSVFKPILEEEYLSDDWGVEDIKLILSALAKLRRSTDDCTELKKKLLIELNAYPKRLIETLNYEQEVPSRKFTHKIHKVLSNEVA